MESIINVIILQKQRIRFDNNEAIKCNGTIPQYKKEASGLPVNLSKRRLLGTIFE